MPQRWSKIKQKGIGAFAGQALVADIGQKAMPLHGHFAPGAAAGQASGDICSVANPDQRTGLGANMDGSTLDRKAIGIEGEGTNSTNLPRWPQRFNVIS